MRRETNEDVDSLHLVDLDDVAEHAGDGEEDDGENEPDEHDHVPGDLKGVDTISRFGNPAASLPRQCR